MADTPALDALLRRVEAHDNAATPGPWEACCTRCGDESDPCGMIWSTPDDVLVAVAHGEDMADEYSSRYPTDERRNANALATGHYRTAAPRLAAIVRVLVEALAFYESGSRNAFRCNNEPLDPAKGTGPCCERVIDAGGIAQDALARAEALAKGES